MTPLSLHTTQHLHNRSPATERPVLTHAEENEKKSTGNVNSALTT